ncbi:putative beta-lysine N-acetyltransferase [Anaerotalea alkaliphila]|uniref:Putative beta-lysine N-acetyltransferase n=1 Tax=Anaerotalea alkaliphila TaxID=2662126 RepID=A0A7X5HTZ9_9FIRM|nr:putative beta-lysine N-acetyltransferase [Anaerotalea alkaliphila]NDL66638.1 putative beta-lysine N-acetyltransferase [Anaerotalea alkaliphila]
MKTFDETIRLGGGLVHHGKQNDRIYVLKTPQEGMERFILQLEELADKNGYGKIVAKVPAPEEGWFLEKGFVEEARIPGFYGNGSDCAFLVRYPDGERQVLRRGEHLEDVLRKAKEKEGMLYMPILEEGFHCRQALESDAGDMAALYRKVFASYPFPIHEPDYIRETMESHVAYFGIWQGERLVGLSSAEMDLAEGNAEMTDFAVDPEYRGKNLASTLLHVMEAAVKDRIRVAYTIARAASHGMNATFSRHGYAFGGTLRNNTQIGGAIESMNVWHKRLQ